MSKLFYFRIKSQRYLLLLLLVVVAFQLLLAQASAYVLAERMPPLSLAVQQQSDDQLSSELVLNLNRIEGFEAISVDPKLSTDKVFRQVRVQGLLIIPANFADNLLAGEEIKVELHLAPGVTSSAVAREQVANTIWQMQSRYDLETALKTIGSEAVFSDDLEAAVFLDVVYVGPKLQGSPLTVAPVFGVSALLLLLAFLHAALTVPTREDKRAVMRGKRAYALQLCVSLLVVWLIWLLVIALYFAFTAVLVGSLPSLLTCLGFVAIMLYVSLLGALLAQLIGRHVASWVFLPLFLLSMTIGGGLWAKVSLTPLLSPLVPVAAVVVPGSATLQGAVVLFAASIVLCVILTLAVKLRFGGSAGASGLLSEGFASKTP